MIAMISKTAPLVLLAVVLSVTYVGISIAEDFSADFVSTMTGVEGAQTMSGKMYVAKDKTRMEMAQGITITRLDKNVAWVLMPGQNMYMEMPISADKVTASEEKMPGEIERTLLGQETIDGKPTNKYRIVYNVAGQQSTIYSWISPDLKFPLKTSAEDGSWGIEYRNISTAKQPDSLFEIPAGYTKFQMPSAGGTFQMPDIGDIAVPEGSDAGGEDY